MTGKVIINEKGEKAISFDDAAWAALPVGATIYTTTPPADQTSAY